LPVPEQFGLPSAHAEIPNVTGPIEVDCKFEAPLMTMQPERPAVSRAATATAHTVRVHDRMPHPA
jgi:hypothetical protein